MSRQLAEQNPQFEEQETLETEDQSSSINRKQKRTDWSEYVDPAEEDDFKSCEIDEIFGLTFYCTKKKKKALRHFS